MVSSSGSSQERVTSSSETTADSQASYQFYVAASNGSGIGEGEGVDVRILREAPDVLGAVDMAVALNSHRPVIASLETTTQGLPAGQFNSVFGVGLPTHEAGDFLLCVLARTTGGSGFKTDLAQSARAAGFGWQRIVGRWRTAASPISIELWAKAGDGVENSLIFSNPDGGSCSWIAHTFRITGVAHTPMVATLVTEHRGGNDNASTVGDLAIGDTDTLVISGVVIDNFRSSHDTIRSPADFSGTLEAYAEYIGTNLSSIVNNGMGVGVVSRPGPDSPGTLSGFSMGNGAKEEWVTATVVLVPVVQFRLPEHGQVRRFSLHRPLARTRLHRDIRVIEVDPDNATN